MRPNEAVRIVAGHVRPVRRDDEVLIHETAKQPSDDTVRENEMGVADVVAIALQQVARFEEGGDNVAGELQHIASVRSAPQRINPPNRQVSPLLKTGAVAETGGNEVNLVSQVRQLAGQAIHDLTAAATQRWKLVTKYQ